MVSRAVDQAREQAARKTGHLSDAQLAIEIKEIVESVRESRPVPGELLGALYQSSAESTRFEVSLTPTS